MASNVAEGRTIRSLRYAGSVRSYVAASLLSGLLARRPALWRMLDLDATSSPAEELPGPRWLRIRPVLTGVCGTDLAVLRARVSPVLGAFASFPAVLGHEIVGRVSELGADVENVSVGQRVVVDPFISCEMRELPPCASCRRGLAYLCINAAEGRFAPGMLLGYCRDLRGGWSEEIVVHRSQIHLVPDRVSDRGAVLVEPFSVALHAVLKGPPPAGAKVLVLGGGTIGLCVVEALRAMAPSSRISMVTRHAFQAELGRQLGAGVVLEERPGARRRAGKAAELSAEAREYWTELGGAVYAGGFDWIYDCVGSNQSIDEALRVAGPRGHLVVVGCAGRMFVDWTFTWARELHIEGSCGYGVEPNDPDQRHTFAIALDLLASGADEQLEQLVTHRFGLAQWAEALSLNLHRGAHEAVKTVFDCQTRTTGDLAAGG
jgi:L-iditol 2-dehydrogenase